MHALSFVEAEPVRLAAVQPKPMCTEKRKRSKEVETSATLVVCRTALLLDIQNDPDEGSKLKRIGPEIKLFYILHVFKIAVICNSSARWSYFNQPALCVTLKHPAVSCSGVRFNQRSKPARNLVTFDMT